MRFKHWNPRVMRQAITAVLEKKMMRETPPECENKKRPVYHIKKVSLAAGDSENSGSDEKSVTPAQKDRKITKCSWNPELMILAVNAVRAKKMGYTRASRVFQIPKPTLLRYLNETETVIVHPIQKSNRGRKKIFTQDEEKELVDYILYVQERYFGLNKDEIKSMILQYTDMRNMKSPFRRGQPGFTWMKTFLKRHSQIIPQNPRETRKHTSVQKFFEMVKQELEEHQFKPDRIFNVDETAFSIVHSKTPQFRLMKRAEQVMRAKRDTFLTVITCMGAAGNFVPPMFIFPRHKVTMDLMRRAPPGAVAACHPSGWVQVDLFAQWFRHFIDVVKPSKDSPALLILDGQQSHSKNIEVIQLAQQRHVSIVSLPPLTLNKLQPVYKSFMDPLKTLYSDEVRRWMNHNLRTLTLDVVVELFGKAYMQVLDLDIGMQGFRDTGIMPLNPEVVAGDFPYIEEEEIDDNQEKSLNANASTPDDSVDLTLGPSTSETRVKEEFAKESRRLGSSGSDHFSEDEDESESDNSPRKVKLEIEFECMFCKQLKSEDTKDEGWVKCQSCELWSHEECAGFDDGFYVCDYCKLNH